MVLVFKELLKQSWLTFKELFKIMAPLVVVVKLLDIWGVDRILASFFEFPMRAVGLPPEGSLVWASAMITNLYGGMITYSELGLWRDFSSAQITILAVMMLMAHNLIVEVRIAQASGIRVWWILSYRLFYAMVLGWLLYIGFTSTGWLQEPSQMIWNPPPPTERGWLLWLQSQTIQFAQIFLLIFLLIALLRGLRRIGILSWTEEKLAPLFSRLGIGRRAISTLFIGLTLGLAYGGALIIQDARSGELLAEEILSLHLFLGLSHSAIEDTILMLLLGAAFIPIFFGKLIFTYLVTWATMKAVKHPYFSNKQWLFYR